MKHVLLAFLLAALAAARAHADSLPLPEPDSIVPVPAVERLAALFPGYEHADDRVEPFPHLSVHDSTDALLGYQLESDLAGTTAKGFIGPVPVRVFCDSLGLLVGVDILDNCETPGYVRLIRNSDLLERLLQYRAGVDTEIDAVTLATHTSLAVVQGVLRTVELLFAPADSIGE